MSKNQAGAAHILLLVAAIGLIGFIAISSSAEFKDKLFSSLFPKPSSHAAGVESKFATAGNGGAALGNLYYYNWNVISAPIPPDQTAAAPSHTFTWIVGKLDDRQDGLSCTPCGRANVDQIYTSEEPKIRALLGKDINKGGVWLVGNEANAIPYIDPADYAYQFDKYRNLIKSLDPTARLANSGLLFLGNQLNDTNPNIFPYRVIPYTGVFLSSLQGAHPDIYNIHLYPNSTNPTDYNNNVTQARQFKEYIVSIGEGNKPIWVTEFGINIPAQESDVMAYMNIVVPALNQSLADRWFWFIGPYEERWKDTSLMNSSGQVSNLGRRYLELKQQYEPTASPTPTPTPTPNPATRTPILQGSTWYWPDAGRCCPQPDRVYAQVLTPLNAAELAAWLANPASTQVVASTPTPTATPQAGTVTFSNISVQRSTTSATITWTTNIASTTKVIYGRSSGNLDLATSVNTNLVTGHSSKLTNLRRDTTYYYKVVSKNSQGTEFFSSVRSFRTRD